ncbi:EamA family transporter, partial [Symbiopectobacterium sp.]
MKNTTAFFTNEKIVFALATLCCLLWGSAYPAIKNGYALFLIAEGDIASKLVFAGYRFVLAGGLLLLLALASGKAIARFKPGQLRQLAVLGITQTTLQYIFFYIGLAYTTGVKGS